MSKQIKCVNLDGYDWSSLKGNQPLIDESNMLKLDGLKLDGFDWSSLKDENIKLFEPIVDLYL